MKVLLCHASLGWGHKRAAQALEEVLRSRGIEPETHDLLDYLPKPMGPFYSHSYTFMITRSRWLWRLVHDWTDYPDAPYCPTRSWWQKWQFGRWKETLERNRYTHIFSTHFTTSALAAEWKKKDNWDTRVFSVVTDYTAHRYWKHEGMDQYFVPTDELAGQLFAAGMPPDRITVSGIPIGAAFARPLPREEARKVWSCGPAQALILVLCSGLNFRKTRILINDILKVPGDIRFLVSAGKHSPNEEFVKDLCKNDPRFTIFGFSSQIAQMMMAADMILTKPGGLVVSESLAAGLPQVLFSPIPGQEEANADFLVRSKAAVCIETRAGFFQRTVQDLLSDRARLASMADAARRLGKPLAASTIINTALG